MHGYSREEARKIGDELGVDWDKIDFKQFRLGMLVEREHGSKNFKTNVTDDDPYMTAKIALAHLEELPDYYTRLKEMEKE
jgi:hypothetical protein